MHVEIVGPKMHDACISLPMFANLSWHALYQPYQPDCIVQVGVKGVYTIGYAAGRV